MLSFEGILTGIAAHIVYKKKQIKGGRYLYAFKDTKKASAEEAAYLANAQKKNTFLPSFIFNHPSRLENTENSAIRRPEMILSAVRPGLVIPPSPFPTYDDNYSLHTSRGINALRQ